MKPPERPALFGAFPPSKLINCLSMESIITVDDDENRQIPIKDICASAAPQSRDPPTLS